MKKRKKRVRKPIQNPNGIKSPTCYEYAGKSIDDIISILENNIEFLKHIKNKNKNAKLIVDNHPTELEPGEIPYLYFVQERLETDKEYAARLKREAKTFKKLEDERYKEYQKLKRHFEEKK